MISMDARSKLMINDHIFREYDIRGVYGKDLTEEIVFLTGKAFAAYIKDAIKKKKIKLSIGRDVRLSSTALRDKLIKGLLESGIDIIDIGECPTPLQYFSLYRLQCDGGIMITGSHNPPEYNGFKLSVGRQTIYGDDIQKIKDIIKEGRFKKYSSGTLKTFNIIDDYIEFMTSRFNSFKGVRVAVDSGNGTAGLVAPRIMKTLGAEVVELYSEPDGRFPNHHPDPVVLENIKDLRECVIDKGVNLGIGFDGDSDRLGVIDEYGEPVWGDMLMIIFARDILKKSPGATIIGEVKCSQTLYDDIVSKGGKAIMWKTGHSLIKKKMKEENALLAGEMSGHIFFADRYYGYDDAIYAALRLLEIIKKSGLPYSIKKLFKDIPPVVSTPEIRFDCPDDKKFKIIDAMRGIFKDYPSTKIDGMRVKFPEGWALVRASNTQPALVLRFEAYTLTSLQEIKNIVTGELKKVISSF